MLKNYPEWQHLNIQEDPSNPFSNLYINEDGSRFYIEPIFYTMFKEFCLHHSEHIQLILDEMQRIVKNNRKVIFTGDYEYPLTHSDEDYIYLELFDITDRLNLYVEDKSRGSDYGD